MRRALAALVLLALPLAGCSVDRDSAGGPTPSPSASASAGSDGSPGVLPSPGGPVPTATAGGNAKQVCAAAVKASSTGTLAYVDELSKLLQAAGTGDQSAAKAAEGRLVSALSTWSKALRQQSGTATDARLKATLEDLATQVDQLGTKIETVDDAKLSAVQDRLDALCGR
jgi:hypothetical protein